MKLGIDLSDVSYDLNQGNKIDILIGADYYWTIMTGKYKRLSPSVVLNETKFGWTLHGQFSNSFNSNEPINAMHVSVWDEGKNDKTLTELQKFWDRETLGIKDDPVGKKLYDKQMLEQFDESIKFSDGRDQVKLSRKFDNIDLANNYDVEKRRFEYLVMRFRKNPSLFKDQKSVMQEYMDKIKIRTSGSLSVTRKREKRTCSIEANLAGSR
ncbi:DUF1758 domain-containing protein [Caerostris extrusa]|uniref:DUF1758 domain-containing protein n=1 Tax=Caerostris extrusa TaxID=172846 RepID=A0AAV4M8I1_CAEEX|nr:DUF1758 domain-containing protein [Caerostris extrusa]